MYDIKDIKMALERLKICLDCDDCLTCGEHDEAIKVAIKVLEEKLKELKSMDGEIN